MHEKSTEDIIKEAKERLRTKQDKLSNPGVINKTTSTQEATNNQTTTIKEDQKINDKSKKEEKAVQKLITPDQDGESLNNSNNEEQDTPTVHKPKAKVSPSMLKLIQEGTDFINSGKKDVLKPTVKGLGGCDDPNQTNSGTPQI